MGNKHFEITQNDVVTWSAWGDRRATLPTKRQNGSCPPGYFSSGTQPNCFPDPESRIAQEWAWQEQLDNNVVGNPNYYVFGKGSVGPTDTTAWGTGNWETYLNTPAQCRDEGGTWIQKTDPMAKYLTGYSRCIFRKGYTPPFVEARRIDDKTKCEAKNFKWRDYGAFGSCYDPIKKDSRTKDGLRGGVNAAVDLGEDLEDITWNLLDFLTWLGENWQVALIGGGVVYFYVLK